MSYLPLEQEQLVPEKKSRLNWEPLDRQHFDNSFMENDEWFRTIFQQVATGISITSMQGQMEQCNSAFCKLLGYTVEELRQLKFNSLVHPDDLEGNMAMISRLVSGEIAQFELENRYIHKDGKAVWVHKFVSLLPDLLGRPAHLIALVSDMTARKHIEEELRISEERFRLVSDNADVGLTRCSRDMFYLSANPAYAKIAGKPLNQIVDRPIIEVIGKKAYEATRPYVERVLRGESVVYEAHVPFSSAGERYLHVSYTPDINGAGEATGWIACVTDITERKRLELELRASIDARDEFISVAAHELKTPLTALHLQLELLKRLASSELEPGSKISSLADASYESVRALSDLLDNLFDTTKIRVGMFALEKQRMDLRTSLFDNVELIRETALLKGSRISVEANEPVNGIWDPKRINQILSNLLSNAVKFGEGKPIDVKLFIDDLSNMVTIEVRDQGIGIPKEMLAKIFKRFERVDNKSISGLGLGLYIVHQVVEAHGGSLNVRSEVGKGSVFTVLLPLSIDQ